MIYGSVCSGIEAATMAWHPLDWKASFFSEIEKFPRQVLAHHYPDTPLHGDFTTIQKGDYEPIELLVGGTPCQSFSVAGLRAGLNDPRGNLMLEFGALAKRLQPKWLVWENVPGVLSSNGGRDFGSFLAMLGELGYTLTKTDQHAVAHAFKVRGGCEGGGKGYLGQDEQAFTLSTGADQQLFHKMQVRRLTPKECERLQGFPDSFTDIPGASDSARYKALGNSMAVPVMAWIGKRIQMVEDMQKDIRQVA